MYDIELARQESNEQISEDTNQIKLAALVELAAVSEACGGILREGVPLVVFAFRPTDQPAFEIGHTKCTECRQAMHDLVENLVGTWRLSFREWKSEYVGLLVVAIDYLDAHSDEYDIQLSGAPSFGVGIVDAEVVNPLYTDSELRRVYTRAQDATSEMDTKDDIWREQCREAFVRALQARMTAHDDDLPMPGDNYVSGGELA